jgi:hypothetical protein
MVNSGFTSQFYRDYRVDARREGGGYGVYIYDNMGIFCFKATYTAVLGSLAAIVEGQKDIDLMLDGNPKKTIRILGWFNE